MTQTDTSQTSAFEREHRRLSVAAVVVFGVLSAILCLLAAMFIRDFNLQTSLRAGLRASYDRRAEIRQVFSLLQDAETGQRGYLLTGDLQYLAPYQNATREIPPRLARLNASAGARSDTTAMAAFGRLSDEKLSELAETVRLRRVGQEQRALSIVRSNRGQHVMDQIRGLMAVMDRDAAGTLAVQLRGVDRLLAQTMAAGLCLGLVFVVALLITGAIIFTAFQHRRRLFTRLEEVATRQAAVLDSAVDAIITLNPSGTIETINPAGERMFGYTAEALLRRDFRVLLELGLKSDGPFLATLGLAPDHAGEPAPREGVGVACDGRRIPVDVSLSPMALEGGTYVVAIVRDISERKRAEEIKDQFVSAVSHELRTPLTSITGSLGLLNGGAVAGLPEGAQRLIGIAYNNSDRLGRLVNDILDIEKIQSGRMPFADEVFDLKTVFRTTVEEMEGYARKFGVRMVMAAGDDRPIWTHGDAARIGQVAANLVSNAVKFSSEGGEVRIGFGRRDGVVQASVSDNGPGIPEAFRSRIFTRFAQADNSDTRQRGGTGLGLAICKEIVDRTGGELFFRSEPGKGARFFVNLPASAGPDAAAVAAPSLQPPQAAPSQTALPQAALPRVLVCEDDLEMSEFLAAVVKAEGGETEVVHSLKQARMAIANGGLACALLDLNLPDGNGLEFLKGFTAPKGAPRLPVVIVSAQERRRLGAMTSGLEIVDWVEKPLTPSRLRQALRAALDVSRRNAEAAKPVILHVEDDPDVIALVADLFKDTAIMVSAASVATAKHALATRSPRLVILDACLVDGSGLGLMPLLTDPKGVHIPTIVFSAQDCQEAVDQADAVLTKSKASLGELASEAHRLLQAQPVARRTEAA